MSGKPVGIKRKLAGSKKALPEKTLISQYGKVAEYDEFDFIKLVEDYLEPEFPQDPAVRKFFSKQTETIIALRIVRAVATLDSDFFGRCQEVIKRLRANLPADPTGLNILEVLKSLLYEPEDEEDEDTNLGQMKLKIGKITSPQITAELDRLFQSQDGKVHDEKDVRDVCKTLNIKFPVDIKELHDAIIAYHRKIWDDKLNSIDTTLKFTGTEPVFGQREGIE